MKKNGLAILIFLSSIYNVACAAVAQPLVAVAPVTGVSSKDVSDLLLCSGWNLRSGENKKIIRKWLPLPKDFSQYFTKLESTESWNNIVHYQAKSGIKIFGMPVLGAYVDSIKDGSASMFTIELSGNLTELREHVQKFHHIKIAEPEGGSFGTSHEYKFKNHTQHNTLAVSQDGSKVTLYCGVMNY